MIYKNLLKLAQSSIKETFPNIKTFENCFTCNEFNIQCYEEMYKKNTYDKLHDMKYLKEKIPELNNMCKKCKEYYMKKRNDSIPVYDVIFGQAIENILIEYLKNYYSINAMHADNSNKKYPDCMILGKNKQILLYFEVKYHAAPFLTSFQQINRPCYEGSATLDQKKIINQLELAESDLDKPIFFIHWIDFPCLKGVFFETSEQIKDYLYNPDTIFSRKMREGDLLKKSNSRYCNKVYSPLLHMGSFEEFINSIKKMDKIK